VTTTKDSDGKSRTQQVREQCGVRQIDAYPANHLTQIAFNRILALFVCCTYVPLLLCERLWFRVLVFVLNPRIRVPNRKQV
jgi:hypothetical protein